MIEQMQEYYEMAERQMMSREDLEAENAKLRDVLENLIIAIGMGWDLDGIIAEAGELCPLVKDAAPNPYN